MQCMSDLESLGVEGRDCAKALNRFAIGSERCHEAHRPGGGCRWRAEGAVVLVEVIMP